MELSEKREWRNEIRYKVEHFTSDRALSTPDWGRFNRRVGDDYIYWRLHGERVGMAEVASPNWAIEDEIPW